MATYYELLSQYAKDKKGFTVLTTLISIEDKNVSQVNLDSAISHSREIFKKRLEELNSRPYLCACEHTQEYFNEQGFNDAYKHAQSSEQILGGWEENGKIYFDSVKNYFTLEAAKEAANRHNQIAFCEFRFQGNDLQPVFWTKKNGEWTT